MKSFIALMGFMIGIFSTGMVTIMRLFTCNETIVITGVGIAVAFYMVGIIVGLVATVKWIF